MNALLTDDKGVYTLQTANTCLDIPVSTAAATAPLSLSSSDSSSRLGTNWWKIESQIDQGSGLVYQTIRNYRSGHEVQHDNTALFARRVGGQKNAGWRIVGSPNDPSIVAVQDTATLGQGISVRSGTVVYGASPEDMPIWTARKVEMDIPGGKETPHSFPVTPLTLRRRVRDFHPGT